MTSKLTNARAEADHLCHEAITQRSLVTRQKPFWRLNLQQYDGLWTAACEEEAIEERGHSLRRAFGTDLLQTAWCSGASKESIRVLNDCEMASGAGLQDVQYLSSNQADERTKALVKKSSDVVLATHIEPRDDMLEERSRASFDVHSLAAYLNGGKEKLHRL